MSAIENFHIVHFDGAGGCTTDEMRPMYTPDGRSKCLVVEQSTVLAMVPSFAPDAVLFDKAIRRARQIKADGANMERFNVVSRDFGHEEPILSYSLGRHEKYLWAYDAQEVLASVPCDEDNAVLWAKARARAEELGIIAPSGTQ